jgi:cytochrome c peroxidase
MRDTLPCSWSLAALMIFAASSAMAQDRGGAAPKLTATSPDALVALGERLFQDKRLSGNLTMSCATCHRPERAFTDGRRHAIGQHGASLGRNTPTLHGLGATAAFPVGGSLGTLAENVALQDRILAPLRSSAELNESVEGAILHLNYDETVAPAFDAAFAAADPASAPVGITAERLATALAAYVRSLTPPPSPGILALRNEETVLSESEQRGLEVFQGGGRCTTCHAGPGLTDGRSHVVATFRQQRQLSLPTAETDDERASSRPNATIVAGRSVVIDVQPASDSPEAHVFEVEFLPPGGPQPRYGRAAGNEIATFDSIERQTPSLIEVRRTAPYFRDGSAASLDQAVRRHVRELREVGRDRIAIAANPELLLAGVTLKVANPPRVALTDSAREQLACDAWIPEKLDAGQVADLVAFLGSLSPPR